jgi:hypothetical protein
MVNPIGAALILSVLVLNISIYGMFLAGWIAIFRKIPNALTKVGLTGWILVGVGYVLSIGDLMPNTSSNLTNFVSTPGFVMSSFAFLRLSQKSIFSFDSN